MGDLESLSLVVRLKTKTKQRKKYPGLPASRNIDIRSAIRPHKPPRPPKAWKDVAYSDMAKSYVRYDP